MKLEPSIDYEEIREKIIGGYIEEVREKIKELEARLQQQDLTVEEQFYALSTLGKFYRKVKNYDKAGDYCRRSLRLSKKLEKPQLEMIIDTYLDYAYLEMEYGQESNARMELAKLLAVLDNNDYRDSYTYGTIFSSLAKVSIMEENIENGIKQYEKALNYFRESLPETHPVLSSTIYKLSDVYIQIEDYPSALELHKQLMEAYQTKDNKRLESKELLRIGEIHFYIDLKEARKIVTNVIKLMAELSEENPLDMAKAVLMLAEIDENMGNFPRAINYYKQAQNELMKIYEESHFMIVYIYSKIGTISIRTFKLDQAKEYLERGLPLSNPFPKIRMQFLYALGKIYSDKKDYDKAQKVFSEFLQRLEQEGRKNSIAYGNTLQAIAFNHLEQENVELAFTYYQDALAIYEKISNCKEEKGLTYIRLAYCYENRRNQDLNKAEECYEKGFNIIEKTRKQELLEESLAGIIEFYNRNNQPVKRKIYEDKFVKLVNKKK
ncbi:lipopolysaccharide assembly protein LapB [Oceanobacillus sp. Castelsardo]|uniref:tetratricopeptide repeat protein n=1 Tax=Oceanobacillus sp. Castelsardo TaxID=1851204 RepID=UPI000838717A|nr:tetratricopeptide repeat protein [Oceanobacillus sp. Castelsardo]